MKETAAFQILVLYRDFLDCTKKEMKGLGLNFGQMPLILYVGKHPGCVQADLTKALQLDWGYSQRSIARLADSGFMTKNYDGEKSGHCLFLTEKGRRAFEAVHEVFELWDRERLKDFSDEEKSLLTALLRKLQPDRK